MEGEKKDKLPDPKQRTYQNDLTMPVTLLLNIYLVLTRSGYHTFPKSQHARHR